MTAVVGWMFVWQGTDAQSTEFHFDGAVPCAQ
jgi:hypothetical protein